MSSKRDRSEDSSDESSSSSGHSSSSSSSPSLSSSRSSSPSSSSSDSSDESDSDSSSHSSSHSSSESSESSEEEDDEDDEDLMSSSVSVTSPSLLQPQTPLQPLQHHPQHSISDVSAGRKNYPHQDEGIGWIVTQEQRKKMGGILADEPGLGKTGQMVDAIRLRGGHTLVILPLSVIPQWTKEFERIGWKCYLFHGQKRSVLELWNVFNLSERREKQPFILLTSYGVVSRTFAEQQKTGKIDVLFRFHWTRVVCDEAHELKTLKAKKTQAFMALSRDFTWFLTGTPVQNRVPEFVSLVYMITRSERVKRLAKGIDQRTLSEIRSLRDEYLLRRTKESLLKTYGQSSASGPRLILPPLLEKVCWVKMKDEDAIIYQNKWEELILRIKNFIHAGGNGSDTAIHIFAAITMLRLFCMHSFLAFDDSKKALLTDFLQLNRRDDILPPSAKIWKIVTDVQSIIRTPDNKVLVFSQWTRVLDILAYYLDIYATVMKRTEPVYVRLEGSTSRKQRQENVDKFQSEGGPQVFLISLKAGGLGLNLHRANYVLLADPYWNPAAEEQARNRAHRCGQERRVTAISYITEHENSIEKFIRELQLKKQEHIASICSDESKNVSLPSLRLFYDHVRRQERERKESEKKKIKV